MESNSSEDWKKKYEVRESVILDYMTDLANYRILVAQLKAEVEHYKAKLRDKEYVLKDRDDYWKQVLFVDIVKDYHESFEN